jgi:hypothetical protein
MKIVRKRSTAFRKERSMENKELERRKALGIEDACPEAESLIANGMLRQRNVEKAEIEEDWIARNFEGSDGYHRKLPCPDLTVEAGRKSKKKDWYTITRRSTKNPANAARARCKRSSV